MPPIKGSSIRINGWQIYAHPLLLDQLDRLIQEVSKHKQIEPDLYRRKNDAKRLAAILKLMTVDVPVDPAAPKFRQGDSLGDDRKHWFRAKFFQQYCLFYRFDSNAKVIIFAWVNDENTLRAYEGRNTDAYAVFAKMLNAGHPPDDFSVLLHAAQAASGRAEASIETATDLSTTSR